MHKSTYGLVRVLHSGFCSLRAVKPDDFLDTLLKGQIWSKVSFGLILPLAKVVDGMVIQLWHEIRLLLHLQMSFNVFIDVEHSMVSLSSVSYLITTKHHQKIYMITHHMQMDFLSSVHRLPEIL